MSDETKDKGAETPETNTKGTKDKGAETPERGMDSKGMIEEHAKAKTVVKYGERINLEIITDTRHYKKGQKIRPHVVMGKQLIKDKIAKEI